MREEQLKNEIAKKYFAAFDTTKIIGNIDFAAAAKNEKLKKTLYLFWAEAKKGNANIENSISQLVLTIGKANTHTKHLPPKFIGCFDSEKIAFIEYDKVQSVFSMHDFNWNVTPSDYKTKEFNIILKKVKTALQEKESFIFDFQKQDSELKAFIKNNFNALNKISQIPIEKENYVTIYYDWLKEVKPTIQVDWEDAEENKILDSDFYLADLLLPENDKNIQQKLRILLENNKYMVATGKFFSGYPTFVKIGFLDAQKAHKTFWDIYKRPPEKKYWDDIIERRDLLVPQDFRERKGSFFTPTIWVQKSQEAITKVLGKNWQSEYYIWDCACGTGNLLRGLTNKHNIFASDIDQSNISRLHSLIKSQSADLLENNCFQFDFLQDSFEKIPEESINNLKNYFDTLPEKLQKTIEPIKNIMDFDKVTPKKLQKKLQEIKDLINNKNLDKDSQIIIKEVFERLPQELQKVFKRILENDFNKLPDKLYHIIKNKPEKLLIYINPPYVEVSNTKNMTGTGKNREDLGNTIIRKRYFKDIGYATRDLFSQFLIRIYKEIPNCKIANFSKLKNLQSFTSKKFRQHFTPKLKSLFLMPADTFDNVNGKFPIGFFIWDGKEKEIFTKITADVFDKNGKNIGTKNIYSYDDEKPISGFIEPCDAEGNIGCLRGVVNNDFQTQNTLCILTNKTYNDRFINKYNLLKVCIYFAVRKVIPHTWQNDRDQFLYPNEKWKDDAEFQNDCLAYTLFHTSNNIKSEEGENHWIPFYDSEIEAPTSFPDNFMAKFINGEIENTQKQNTFKGMEKECFIPKEKLMFSKEAKAVFEAGKALFKYYHSKKEANVNASFYDIRGYFQGFKELANGKKRMNAKSKDVKYNELLKILKTKLQLLGNKIAPKIYEYGFLLK